MILQTHLTSYSSKATETAVLVRRLERWSGNIVVAVIPMSHEANHSQLLQVSLHSRLKASSVSTRLSSHLLTYESLLEVVSSQILEAHLLLLPSVLLLRTHLR
jgi:hypothetical protein